MTDGSNYESQAQEDMSLNYSHFAQENSSSPEVNGLVVADRLPIFKNELSQVILASGGNVYRVEPNEVVTFELPTQEYQVRWEQIFLEAPVESVEIPLESFDVASDEPLVAVMIEPGSFEERTLNALEGFYQEIVVQEPKWREAVEDLWAAHNGHLQLQTIKDESSWLAAAQAQGNIALRAHIVNTFNSLIALENQWQQDQLDREKEADDKYRSDHDIGEADEAVLFDVTSQQRGDEPSVALILLVISILGSGFFFKKQISKWY